MKTGLWTAFEAACATGGALAARGGKQDADPDRWVAEEWAAGGVSIDSRTIEPGELFVALKDARDGHEFVESAFARGAAAALVDQPPTNAPDGAPFLVVSDTFEGLRNLARAARARNFGKRIGVTGSAGKTSTKEMMRAALAPFGRVHAADRSFNNHYGVPLTLARMPMTADFGVFEIGMNHAGEITPLTKLVAPHVAIVTTVAAAHLEFFDSVAAIAEAKAEIFSGVARGGAAVLPIDNDHYGILLKRAEEAGISRRVTFGESAKADFRLVSYRTDGVKGEAVVAAAGERLEFTLAAPGRHQAMNALAVLAAIKALGLPCRTAAAGIARLPAAEGRGAQSEVLLPGGARITLIDESYNANPASMRAAISLLGAAAPRGEGRRIAILGDMLELGPDSPSLHKGLAEPLVEAGVDRVFAVGKLTQHLWGALPKGLQGAAEPDAATLAAYITKELREGDVVMVKGSNSSKVSLVARALRATASA